jgi:acetyl esterase/lipase
MSALGIVVVSVDYRLAPEHCHPAALHDCHAVLRWLAEFGTGIGVDRHRIAIGGESAGAGLAANLALLARDRQTGPIAFQALMYPMLDDRTGSVAPVARSATEQIWPSASNVYGWSALLGRRPAIDPPPPYAAAARADNLAGLPPAFMAVAGLDILRDENIEYSRRLMQAGVATQMHVYPGMVHAFDLARDSAAAQRMIADLHGALGRALGLARQDQDD